MNRDEITGIVRHLLTAAGGAGLATNHDNVVQLLSAIITVIGLAWSIIEKRQRGPGAPTPPPAVAGLILCGLAGSLLSGCTTTPAFVSGIVTPERIESVSALAGYLGGKAVIAKGHRAELEAANEALKAMQSAGVSDMPAVAAALQAAGIDQVTSEEGLLVLGAVTTFQDLWSHTAQPILDDPRAKAVRDGLIRGFNMALTAPAGSRDPVEAQLRAAAQATR